MRIHTPQVVGFKEQKYLGLSRQHYIPRDSRAHNCLSFTNAHNLKNQLQTQGSLANTP